MGLRTATFLLTLCSVAVAQEVPPGTVLPVTLNSTLDARRSKPGQPISSKVMQDVPLPDGSKIQKGSKILGHVVSASSASAASPAHIAVSFDQVKLDGRTIRVAIHLRALASPFQVFEAKLPTNSIDDYGTSTSDWNTIQIGGAGVFRGSGEVVQDGDIIGRTTDYGAVTAKLAAAPKKGCKGDGGPEQALWLFSPSACGIYGYPDLTIVRGDTGGSPGVIELESKGNLRIEAGSGWLLRTNGGD